VQTQQLEQAKANLAKARSALDSMKAQQAKTEENDNETRPVELAQARLEVKSARENLAFVSGMNIQAGAVVTPEGAQLEAGRLKDIANARRALRDAQDAYLKALGVEQTLDVPGSPTSIANAAARQRAIADAHDAVLQSSQDLEDEQDLEKRFSDAQDDVIDAQNALDNARRDLAAAQLAETQQNRDAVNSRDDAQDAYTDLYAKYLGITLTDEELVQEPDALFAQWGVDLKTLFDRNTFTLPDGQLKDDPDTRYNELQIWAWLSLHPSGNSVDVRCNDVSGRLSGCLQADFQDAWDDFETASNSLNTIETNNATRVAAAQNAITVAQRYLDDAQEAFDDFDTEKPNIDVEIASANLAKAVSDLNELEDFPDPVSVAEAEAAMATAQANLDDLLDWPDPLQIELAQQRLTKAQTDLARLEKGRDPLIVARENADIAAAESDVSALEAAVQLATIALDDMQLKAPFTGTVVSTPIDVGEEVSPETIVVRLADVSQWILETDDLDELSVVNLNEGDTVQVSFDALPQVTFQGRVFKINEFGVKKQGAITYTAEIHFDDQDSRLRWNMSASIKKETETASLTPGEIDEAQARR
jgi:hypothetical protein